MSEEVTPSTGQETATPEVPVTVEAPKDYREYARWRKTGELPETKEETPAAAGTGADATETQAETGPAPEPEKTQETGEQDQGDEGGRKNRPGSRERRERKLEQALAEIEELKRQVAGQSVKPPQDRPSESAKPPAEGKPKLDDYETLEAYQEALTDWKLDQRDRAQKAAAAEREAREAHEKLQDAWSKQVKAAAKVHEDFDEVIDSVKAPEGPGVEAGRQAMLEDKNGAEILYWLGKHPEELKRIAALSPVSAVLEIGKLSAKFDSPVPENGKPQLTGAPKPPPGSVRPSRIVSDSINDPAVLHDFRRYVKVRAAMKDR